MSHKTKVCSESRGCVSHDHVSSGFTASALPCLPRAACIFGISYSLPWDVSFSRISWYICIEDALALLQHTSGLFPQGNRLLLLLCPVLFSCNDTCQCVLTRSCWPHICTLTDVLGRRESYILSKCAQRMLPISVESRRQTFVYNVDLFICTLQQTNLSRKLFSPCSSSPVIKHERKNKHLHLMKGNKVYLYEEEV